MDSWVGYLGFDHSVLAKFVSYPFYSSFCAGMWLNFGVFRLLKPITFFLGQDLKK